MADPSGSPSVVRDADTSVVKGALEAEFTFRAVFVGLSIGVLLAFTNTYFGLQSGWVSMMSLQASLVGFAVFKVLPHSRLFGSRPLTVHENIVLQTTAVATGTLPLAAGLVGIIPALGLLTLDEDGSLPIVLSPWSLIGWCGAVAFFGCFLAVPLRRQVIVKEKLVFPSGTATAQIIGMLHSVPLQRDGPLKAVTSYSALPSSASEAGDDDEDEADESAPEPKLDEGEWSALSWSFSASSIFTILSLMFPVIYAIPIFDVFGYLAHDWLWWFTPSFSYVGQGIIMGFPTTASMNLGMLCGWAFLAPLSKLSGWAPGPVGSTVNGARGWILWPALAIMTAESILSLSLVAVSVFSRRPKTSISSTRERGHSPARPEIKEDEADTCLVIGGVILSCISCVILVSIVFGEDGIKWWATVLALGLASIFSILGVRALGETDLNPVSAIGKISQLLFAIIQPHNIVANLIAGGISEAGAQQAGDLMQDLKTGHLHGASPRAQFYGQLIGSAASVFVSSGIYILYRRVYELPSTSFPVPSAGIWLNLARLVNNGKLPPKTKEAMAIFGVVFIALASLKLLGASRSGPRKLAAYTRFFPSGIGFAVGFINTPSFSIARLIGGLISLYYTRRHARTSSTPATSSSHLENIPLIIVASGFVLGEGLASIVGLVAKSFGAGPLSCFGCHSGGGGLDLPQVRTSTMGVFDGSIGAFVAGTFISTFLLGVTATQAYNYYGVFGRSDRRVYFWMVTGLLALDWVHSIVSCMTVYKWTVSDYGDIMKLVDSPWTFAVDPAMTGIAASVVQVFYAYRVYVVGKRERVLIPILVCALSLVQLGFACASTGMIFKLQAFSKFHVFTYGVSIWLGSASICDILITCSLVYNLMHSKSGILQTNSVINRLVEIVIQTNGLTAICSIVDAVLFGVLNTSYHVTVNLCLVKLYFNSLLVSLNARHELEAHLLGPRIFDFPSDGTSPASLMTPSTSQEFKSFVKQRTDAGQSGIQVKVSTLQTVVTDVMDKDEYEKYAPASPTSPSLRRTIKRDLEIESSYGNSPSQA